MQFLNFAFIFSVFYLTPHHQEYVQVVHVTNTLKGTVEANIKPGAAERYTVLPSTVKLKPNETAALEIRLKVLKFANRQKAVELGHRDVFHIKGTFFDQKFYSTFFLAADVSDISSKQPGAGIRSSASAPQTQTVLRSPSSSPPRPSWSSSPTSGVLKHLSTQGSSQQGSKASVMKSAKQRLAKSVTFASPLEQERTASRSRSRSPTGRARSFPLAPSSVRLSGRASAPASPSKAEGSDASISRSRSISPPVSRGLRDVLGVMQSAAQGDTFGKRPPSPSIKTLISTQDDVATSWKSSLRPSYMQRESALHDSELYARGGADLVASGISNKSMVPPSSLPSLTAFSPKISASPASRLTPNRYVAPLPSPAELLKLSPGRSRSSESRLSNSKLVVSTSPRQRYLESTLEPPRPAYMPTSSTTVLSVTPQPTSVRDSSLTTLLSPSLLRGLKSPSALSQPLPVKSKDQAEPNHPQGVSLTSSRHSQRVTQHPLTYLDTNHTADQASSLAMATVLEALDVTHNAKLNPGGGGGAAADKGPKPLNSTSLSAAAAPPAPMQQTCYSPERPVSAGFSPERMPLSRSIINARSPGPTGSTGTTCTGGALSPSGVSVTRSPGGSRSRAAQIAANAAAVRSAFGMTEATRTDGSRISIKVPQPAMSKKETGSLNSPSRSVAVKPVPSTSENHHPVSNTNPTSHIKTIIPSSFSSMLGLPSGGNTVKSISSGAAHRPAGSRATDLLRVGSDEESVPELQMSIVAASRREEGLQSMMTAQLNSLRDKDEVIQALRAKLAVASARSSDSKMITRTEEDGLKSGTSVRALSEENASLMTANRKLEVKVKSLEGELNRQREELGALRKLTLEMQARRPELARAVEAAIQVEQAVQEERNRKALEVLSSKDAALKAAEVKMAEMDVELRRVMVARGEAYERADTAEGHVLEVLQRQEEERAEALQEKQSLIDKLADLESQLINKGAVHQQVNAWRSKAQDSERQLSSLLQQMEDQAVDMERMQVECARMQAKMLTAESKAQAAEQDLACVDADLSQQIRSLTTSHRDEVRALEEKLLDLQESLDLSTRKSSNLVADKGKRGIAEGLGMSELRQQLRSSESARIELELDLEEGARKAERVAQAAAAREKELQAQISGLRNQVEKQHQQYKSRRPADSALLRDQSLASDRGDIVRLQDLLVDREHELARLRSQMLVRERAFALGVPVLPEGVTTVSSGIEVPTGQHAAKGAAAAASPKRGNSVRSSVPTTGPRVAGKWQPPPPLPSSVDTNKQSAVAAAAAAAAAGSATLQLVQELQEELAGRDFQLRLVQERAAVLESQLSVLQEPTSSGRADVGSVNQDFLWVGMDTRRMEDELALARATTSRLNARVNELVAAEQVALEKAEDAAAQLSRAKELHRRDLQALEERHQLVLGQQANSLAQPLEDIQMVDGERRSPKKVQVGSPGQLGLSLSLREEQMTEAVETAEAAVAVVQARLMEALKSKAELSAEVSRVRRDAEVERAKLELEARAAREDRSLKIRNLEEALQRLTSIRPTGESQLPLELVKAVAESDTARRAEARLRSEVEYERSRVVAAEQRYDQALQAVQDKDTELAEAWTYCSLLQGAPPPSCGTGISVGISVGITDALSGTSKSVQDVQRPMPAKLGGVEGVKEVLLDVKLEKRLRSQMEELMRKQQIIAKLMEEGERSQREMDKARAEVAVLRRQLASFTDTDFFPLLPLEGEGSASVPGAVSSTTNPGTLSTLQLQRQLAAKEMALGLAKEGKEMAEVEAQKLQAALDESRRESAALRLSLEHRSRELAEAEDQVARHGLAVSSALSAEVSTLTSKAASAEALGEAERSGRLIVESELEETRAALTAARSDAQERVLELKTIRERLAEEDVKWRERLAESKKDTDRARAEAAERKAQVTVLMDTIEALNAGSEGERETRLVALTAQLAASRTSEAVLEVRARELLAEAESWQARTSALHSQLQLAAAQAVDREQQLTAAEGSRSMMEKGLEAARADLKQQTSQCIYLSRSVDACEQRSSVLEAESAGIRKAMLDGQARHSERLVSEREEAAATLRHVRSEFVREMSEDATAEGALGGGTRGGAAGRIQASIDELVSQVKGQLSSQAPGTDVSSWAVSVMYKLKSEVLDAYRQAQAAQADTRLAQGEVQAARLRIQTQQTVLEQRTADWRIAEVAWQQLKRSSARRSETAARQAAETATSYEERLRGLHSQLDRFNSELATATAQAAASGASLISEKSHADALKRQLSALVSEKRELAARLAAAQIEAAGNVQGLLRAGTSSYLQSSTYPQSSISVDLLSQDEPAHVTALKREVGALRVVESQLQASVAAANKRADAYSMRAGSLAEALRELESKIQDLSAQKSSPFGSPTASSSELAKLMWKLGSSSKEAAQAKEQVLKLKQALERMEVDAQDMHAQAAASELLLQQVRDEGAAALLQQREHLSSLHDADRGLLLREMSELQRRINGLRRLAVAEAEASGQRALEAQQATTAELERQVSERTAGLVEVSKLDAALARASSAEGQVEEMKSRLQELLDETTRLKSQVSELLDVKELTTAAVAGLEATLERIEKSSGAGNPAQIGGTAAGSGRLGSARRVPVTISSEGGGSSSGDGSISGLSRELVRAKLSEAEAMRKLRASARSEADLQHKLIQRDLRITSLKETLGARNKAYDEAKRKLHELSVAAGGSSTLASSLARRARSPVRGQLSSKPSTKDVTSRSGSDQGQYQQQISESGKLRQNVMVSSGQRIGLRGRPVARSVSPQPRTPLGKTLWEEQEEAEHQSVTHGDMMTAVLYKELEEKKEEIARLRDALTEALSLQPGSDASSPHGASLKHSIEHLRAELAEMHSSIASAVSNAKSLTRKLQSVVESGSQSGVRGVMPSPLATSLRSYATEGTAHSLRDAMQELASLVSDIQAAHKYGILLGNATSPPRNKQYDQGYSGRQSSLPSPGLLAALQLEVASKGMKRGVGAVPQNNVSSIQELHLRLSHQETEKELLMIQVSELKKRLQQHEGGEANTMLIGRAVNAGRVGSVLSLAELLNNGLRAAGAASRKLQAALAAPGQVVNGEVRTVTGTLVTEVAASEATIGMLVVELEGLVGGAREGSLQAVAGMELSGLSKRNAAFSPDFSFPGLQREHAVRPARSNQQTEVQAGSYLLHHPLYQGASISQLGVTSPGGASAVGSETSSWHTVTPGPTPYHQSSGIENRRPKVSVGVQAGGGLLVGKQEMDMKGGATSGAGSASEAVGAASATVLAESLVEMRAVAERWKEKCGRLSNQLSSVGSSLSAREAAAAERASEVERQLEQQASKSQAEVQRLQVALAGAQAARKEAEQQYKAAAAETNAVASSMSSSSQAELRAAATKLAEAQARSATLTRQLETERQQGAAVSGTLKDEIQSLRAMLAQEQGERTRLMTQMRETMSSVGAASRTAASGAGSESQQQLEVGALRDEVLKVQQEAARAKAGRERAEAQAITWKKEARGLRERLTEVEKVCGRNSPGIASEADCGGRALLVSQLKPRMEAVEGRFANSSQSFATKLAELESRILASSSLKDTLPAAEARIQQLEQQLLQLSSQLQEEALRHKEQISSTRWTSLSKVNRYQRMIQQLSQDKERLQSVFSRERAELQVAVTEANRRASAAESESQAAESRMSELRTVFDAERQSIAQKQVLHLQEMQKRIESERQAMDAESAARVESEALAREQRAQEEEAVKTAQLESRYMEQLRLLEGERLALEASKDALTQQFRQYQGLKTQELQLLEERIIRLITGGASEAPGMVAEAAAAIRQSMMALDYSHVMPAASVPGVKAPRMPANAGVRRQQVAVAAAAGGEPGGMKSRRGSVANVKSVKRGLMAKNLSAASAAAGSMYSEQGPKQRYRQHQAQVSALYGAAVPEEVAEVAAAAEADIAAAARREALFERLHRQRAEALLSAARTSLSRLKNRLKLSLRTVKAMQEEGLTREEHVKLMSEVSVLRDKLKAAHAESARRGRALQLLQGVMPNPGDAGVGAGTSSSAAAANNNSNVQRRWVSSTRPVPATMAGLSETQLVEGDSTSANANAALAMKELESERLAREAVEVKLRDSRHNVERKMTVIRDLQRRLLDLEGLLPGGSKSGAVEAIEVQETKVKQLQAACARKDVLIKELKERLDQKEASADREEEGRLARAAARMKAELQRRESGLKQALRQLEEEKQESLMLKKESRLQKDELSSCMQRLATGEERVRELVKVIRGMSASIEMCINAIQRAVSSGRSNRTGSMVPEAQVRGSLAHQEGGGNGLFVDEIASLTDLSLSDIHAILGRDREGDDAEDFSWEKEVEPYLMLIENTALDGVLADDMYVARKRSEALLRGVEWEAKTALVLIEAVARCAHHAAKRLLN
ncbi:hypothetical protein CEUSTIGMA_g10584.t1 [Chlamydomonas eustigma]|uniref:MSP domain-containing protein n=1 Tax=Chlamydomonas eustigma TaxID=1157962 RepID=A0A250XJA8_9CHLO|nr:hypothetical protein CEUSTIGMA_g10584.t1 [Chlamydomonas eustigma]|eukprot:GAX83158.1 hypothetical protein CEUSTIGMA_g10584.t1 [Chlamydomonas eustigma]